MRNTRERTSILQAGEGRGEMCVERGLRDVGGEGRGVREVGGEGERGGKVRGGGGEGKGRGGS